MLDRTSRATVYPVGEPGDEIVSFDVLSMLGGSARQLYPGTPRAGQAIRARPSGPARAIAHRGMRVGAANNATLRQPSVGVDGGASP